MVIEAKKVFQNNYKGRKDDSLISIAYESLNINVSPKMLDRALVFFNSLILGVKRIGGAVEVKPHHSRVIYIGERMEVSLREKQNRILKENKLIHGILMTIYLRASYYLNSGSIHGMQRNGKIRAIQY